MPSTLRASDILPLGDFKSNAATCLRDLQDSGRPVVLTQNGRPAAVLLAPELYDAMVERERFLTDVAEGIADADAGRVIDTATLRERVASRLRR